MPYRRLALLVALVAVAAMAVSLLSGRAQQDPGLDEGSISGNRDGTPGRRTP